METMTEHTMTVDQALEKLRQTEVTFRSRPHFNATGDSLTLYFSDLPAYSQRIDSILTVYRSMESNEITGFKIKGVSLLAENVVNIFKIEDGEIEIRWLLLSALGTSLKPRSHYYDLGEKCGTIKISVEEILRKAA